MARGRRRESKTHIRRLQKMGKYTYYVTIPAEYIDKVGWREKQKVVVIQEGEKFIIEDWKPKKKR